MAADRLVFLSMSTRKTVSLGDVHGHHEVSGLRSRRRPRSIWVKTWTALVGSPVGDARRAGNGA